MQRWLKRVTPDRHTLEKHLVFEALHGAGARPRLLDVQPRQRHPRVRARACLSPLFRPRPCPCIWSTCALLGVFFRLNLPVLIATVFISNPFTWVPQVAGSLWVGAKLMGWI